MCAVPRVRLVIVSLLLCQSNTGAAPSSCNRTLLALSGCAAGELDPATRRPGAGACNMSSVVPDWDSMMTFGDQLLNYFLSSKKPDTCEYGCGRNCAVHHAPYSGAIVAPCGPDLAQQDDCVFTVPGGSHCFHAFNAHTMQTSENCQHLQFGWGNSFKGAAAAPCGEHGARAYPC